VEAVTVVAVVVAADVVSHKVKAPIHKRAQMTSHKIQQRIQKKVQRARHIVAVVAVAQQVMTSLQVK
jgi:hypothetical protein